MCMYLSTQTLDEFRRHDPGMRFQAETGKVKGLWAMRVVNQQGEKWRDVFTAR